MTGKEGKTDMKKKNLQYGGTAIAFTAAFIAIVVVVNIIFTALASHFNWYSDLTSSGIYSVSDEFKQSLDNLFADVGEDVSVNIVLMSEEDMFSSSSTEAYYVYKTLKQVETYSDRIHLIGINSTREKSRIKRYMITEYDTVYTNDIVFELADGNGNADLSSATKKYQLSAFFKKNTDGKVVGYNAEARILSAVAQLLNKSDKPIAYYLQGHNEPTLREVSEWQEVLTTAGYEVREIWLRNEDFDCAPGENRNNDILIINAPVYDLLAPTEEDPTLVSEKDKIHEFLVKNYGNMIVTEGASTMRLPILEGLLYEWGITYTGAVTDSLHSASSSSGAAVMADSSRTTDNVPSQLISRALGAGSGASVVFSNPKAMTVEKGALSLVGGFGSQAVYPLLKSYDTAITRLSESESVSGNANLAAIGMADWDLNDEGNKSYVLALGTTSFLSYGSSANESILYSVLDLMGSNAASFDNVTYKSFDTNSLSATTAQANAWTIVCVIVLPLMTAAVGVYVWIRRRHS